MVRLVPQCEQQERVLCEAVPYQQEIQRCVLTNNPVCTPQVRHGHMSRVSQMSRVMIVHIVYNSQAVGDAVTRVCRDIPTEVCDIEIQDEGCVEEPRRICETRLVPVTRTVQREECGNTNDVSYSSNDVSYSNEIFSYARDFYETKFL